MPHISRLLAAATLTLSLAGCSVFDRYLKVTSPELIQTGILEQPQNSVLLSQSAIGDFECAYGAYIVVNGLVSGELIDGTLTAARWDYDRRTFDETSTLYSTGSCDENTGPGLGNYTPIQTARHTNDRTLQLLRGWTDTQVAPNNRQQLMDTSAVYAGFARLMLGESFCSAPDSELGASKTSLLIFADAERLFNFVIDSIPLSALQDTGIRYVAYAGRARARLDQGNLAGAASDADSVPSGFRFDATAIGGDASGHRENRVYAENFSGGLSIQDAYLGLTVPSGGGTVPDTRVNIGSGGGAAADGRTTLYVALKDSTPVAAMRVASYQEAQLTIAEAVPSRALAAINNARAADGMPAYSGPTDAATLAAQVTEERRRELFLEGTRLYDERRLSLPLVPTPGVSYSTATHKGGTYGNQTCFPLPDVEKFNNPSS